MSDLENTVESTDAPVDRKELLAQQFDEVEQAPADRPRDEAGKYAKAEKAASRAAEAPAEGEPPVWRRPPASWKKDYHEPWNTVDDKIKEYVWQREEQMRKGVEPLLSKAQFADSIQEAIDPFLPTIRGMGLEPAAAVKALMQADYTLRNSPPDQKLAYFHQLAAQYGINLGQQGFDAQQQPQMMDPRLFALQNELNNVRGEVLTWKQQQEAIQNQSLLGEINEFSQSAEHFEAARPVMISLLQTGQANTLQEAYDKAIWSDPEIRQNLIEAQQAERMAKLSDQKNRAAKAARAAAVSVRSSTPGTNTAPKANDRRSMLAEQFDSMNDRL